MKKISFIILIVLLVSGVAYGDSEIIERKDIELYFDDKRIESETPIVELNGVKYISAKQISEYLDAYMFWNDTYQTVEITKYEWDTMQLASVEKNTDKLNLEQIDTLKKYTAVITSYDMNGELLNQSYGIRIGPSSILFNYQVIEEAFYYIVRVDGNDRDLKLPVLTWSKENDLAIARIAPHVEGVLIADEMPKINSMVYMLNDFQNTESHVKKVRVGQRITIDESTYFKINVSTIEDNLGRAIVNEYGELIGFTTIKEVNSKKTLLVIPCNELQKQIKYMKEYPSEICYWNYISGNIYFGEANEKVQYHGFGKIIFKDGAEAFEGNFYNGRCYGYGTYYFKSGSVLKGFFNDYYVNGYGEYMYANGVVYKGTLKNNDHHGYGCLYFEDGAKLYGKWQNGVKQGIFIFEKPNGYVCEYLFEDDELVKGYILKEPTE